MPLVCLCGWSVMQMCTQTVSWHSSAIDCTCLPMLFASDGGSLATGQRVLNSAPRVDGCFWAIMRPINVTSRSLEKPMVVVVDTRQTPAGSNLDAAAAVATGVQAHCRHRRLNLPVDSHSFREAGYVCVKVDRCAISSDWVKSSQPVSEDV